MRNLLLIAYQWLSVKAIAGSCSQDFKQFCGKHIMKVVFFTGYLMFKYG